MDFFENIIQAQRLNEFFQNERNRSRLGVVSFELKVDDDERRDDRLEQNHRDLNSDRDRRIFNDQQQQQQQQRQGQPSLIDSSTTTAHIVEIFSKTPILTDEHYRRMKEFFKDKITTGGGKYTSTSIHSSNRLMTFHYRDCQSKKGVLDAYVSFLAVLLFLLICFCVFYLLLKKKKKTFKYHDVDTYQLVAGEHFDLSKLAVDNRFLLLENINVNDTTYFLDTVARNILEHLPSETHHRSIFLPRVLIVRLKTPMDEEKIRAKIASHEKFVNLFVFS